MTKSASPSTGSPAPGSRRAAREAALRVLYTVDVGKQPVEEATEQTFAAHTLEPAMADFARSLISGTLRNRTDIDKEIDKFAVGFPIARQTAVDRNILRMAAGEILFPVTHAPAGAVVNEAVELAKKYSTSDSGKFVNGVLGALVRDREGKLEAITDIKLEETNA
jgi:N utilization substance protein B